VTPTFYREPATKAKADSQYEGKCRLPAAMMAGVVDRLMSFEDLFDAVMGEGYAMAA
jgi:hypothetical protein